jgi:dolichyl-phosphate-mannose--protein O-mannosyl transferase
MLAVFSIITLTCLGNLAAVLHILNAGTFLASRDTFGMIVSLVNLLTFFSAAAYWYQHRAAPDSLVPAAPLWRCFAAVPAGNRKGRAQRVRQEEDLKVFEWLRTDTIALLALVGMAAALRFWQIGHPGEIVFDEVHFVGQARHYIRSEPFLDPHPPVAKLLIAAAILIFGDQPSSWRLSNALLGTVMVGVTYLLGRRMFHSRLAATLAAGLVALDGFFIVDSRIGCIDIVYLTLAAIAYLLFFRFVSTQEFARRRRLLLVIGMVLGLCLGAKLYVPVITFLLVGAFLLFTLWSTGESATEPGANSSSMRLRKMRFRWVMGAALITGSISGIFYLVAFLPHYALGWWGGIADLAHYYKDVMWYENSVASASHPYASPWWSWPLMLRPVAYWQNFPTHGNVAVIWGGGNPLTWWAVVPAMMITSVRALERPTVTRIFVVTAFFAYYLIWIPIGRILFLYHYLPSVYIGYLALAAILADMWDGEAETWESFAILLSMMPVLIVGVGHIASEYRLGSDEGQVLVGSFLAAALLISYILLIIRHSRADRFACAAFLSIAVALFVYYLPIWLGLPISRTGYYARMWFQGPGLRNWI